MSQLTPKSNKDLKNKSKVHSQDSIPSFIRKTYDILEEHKFPDIIDWNPEGTALVIKKPSEFCQKVLPTYFKHNNLTSFVRQLNMYNFHKRRTQNLDHVYYHELFQRGKKHLLKEIKRKNHDHGADKGQKIGENYDIAQSGKDFSSVCYENQLLKRLYNDAMNKINILENQMKEISAQNETLWNQVYLQNENKGGAPFKQGVFKIDSKTELTQDQLPMTFNKEVIIPPLKIVQDTRTHISPNVPYAKVPGVMNNVNCYLSFAREENSGESTTDASHTSPSLQPPTESDKCTDAMEASAAFAETYGQGMQFPTITITPQISAGFHAFRAGDLMLAGKEMSIGNLFDSWNVENQTAETFQFADQKPVAERQLVPQDNSVLRKRPFELAEGQEGGAQEPMMKREISLFFRRGLFSQGVEDLDPNQQGIDLMDFNQNFFFTKAA